MLDFLFTKLYTTLEKSSESKEVRTRKLDTVRYKITQLIFMRKPWVEQIFQTTIILKILIKLILTSFRKSRGS